MTTTDGSDTIRSPTPPRKGVRALDIQIEENDVSPLDYDFTEPPSEDDTPTEERNTPTEQETTDMSTTDTDTPKRTRKPMSLETALSKTYTIRTNAAGAQAGIPGPIAELVAGRSYRWEFSETGLSLVFVEEHAAEEIQLPSWAS